MTDALLEPTCLHDAAAAASLRILLLCSTCAAVYLLVVKLVCRRTFVLTGQIISAELFP